MAVEDRGALVARAIIDLLNAALPQPELHLQLVELLRDEFADVQREAVAYRELGGDDA